MDFAHSWGVRWRTTETRIARTCWLGEFHIRRRTSGRLTFRCLRPWVESRDSGCRPSVPMTVWLLHPHSRWRSPIQTAGRQKGTNTHTKWALYEETKPPNYIDSLMCVCVYTCAYVCICILKLCAQTSSSRSSSTSSLTSAWLKKFGQLSNCMLSLLLLLTLSLVVVVVIVVVQTYW